MLTLMDNQKELVSQFGIMARSNMQSIIMINPMESVWPSGLMEIATWERSKMVANTAMAHFIGLKLEIHTLGSLNMVRVMAMVLIHGLMAKLITDSIFMIIWKDMDSGSNLMVTSMTASGKMTRNQARESKSTQQQESFKESSGKMTSASK